MLNCHGVFRPQEVWFLVDTCDLKNRRFEFGFCPFCENWIVGLFEKSKNTGEVFYTRARDKKAKRLYEELKSQIDYKKTDIKGGSKSNMGFVYGKNEKIRVDGKEIIVQKSVDFNGTEKIVKKII